MFEINVYNVIQRKKVLNKHKSRTLKVVLCVVLHSTVLKRQHLHVHCTVFKIFRLQTSSLITSRVLSYYGKRCLYSGWKFLCGLKRTLNGLAHSFLNMNDGDKYSQHFMKIKFIIDNHSVDAAPGTLCLQQRL